MTRDRAEVLAIVKKQASEFGPAKGVRLLQNRVEHRGEIAGRGVDDLQYLRGSGLLLQCLARFRDKPRILHCDDRLCGKVLQQRNLLVGKRSHLLTEDAERANESTLFAQCHGEDTAVPITIHQLSEFRARAISVAFKNVFSEDNVLAANYRIQQTTRYRRERVPLDSFVLAVHFRGHMEQFVAISQKVAVGRAAER